MAVDVSMSQPAPNTNQIATVGLKIAYNNSSLGLGQSLSVSSNQTQWTTTDNDGTTWPQDPNVLGLFPTCATFNPFDITR